MNLPLFPLAPYEHQKRAVDFIDRGPGGRRRSFYALLMEQGTGKTPIFINDAARRWAEGEVDRVLVMAPSGVHSNWTLREIPKHLPLWAREKTRYAAWYAGPNKAEKAQLEELQGGPEGSLRVLSMNWESLTTANGLEFATRFLKQSSKGAMGIGDESQKIKSPTAIRTKRLMKHLRPLLRVRAIGSGTAIINSPWDAFSQFGYLHPLILRTESYTAFKAEYAELLPEGHGLLRHIAQRTQGRQSPQIVARDPVTGRPKWKNLDKLDQLIDQHSFRVLKKDCLDLPPKVYGTRHYRMTPKQRTRYEELRDDLRLRIGEDHILPVQRIASITKLSQICSGYFIAPGFATVEDPEAGIQRIFPVKENPKIHTLMDELEDFDGQTIIWARFHVEIEDICSALSDAGISHVEYHGGVKRRNRAASIDAFESGTARVFVGQQAAGGTGLTLIAPASVSGSMKVIYYSNTWSLEDRLQSEDRAHRIGQSKSVSYTDLTCQGTIEERIVDALKSKDDLKSTVLGDKRRALALLQ